MSPTCSRACSASASAAGRRRSVKKAGTSTFSRTVSSSNGRSVWKVRPHPARALRKGGERVTSRSNRKTFPARGRTKPVRALKRVVLPAPFGPMSPRISPVRRDRDTLSTAVTPPKRTVIPSALSALCITTPDEVARQLADDAARQEQDDDQDEEAVD